MVLQGKNDGKCGLVGGHAYSMNGAFVVSSSLFSVHPEIGLGWILTK